MTKQEHLAHEHQAHPADRDPRPAYAPPVAAPDVVLTEDEYQKQKADLDAQLAALEVAHVTSVAYPRWLYHATDQAQIVASPAAAEALGAGWQETPVEPPAAHKKSSPS